MTSTIAAPAAGAGEILLEDFSGADGAQPIPAGAGARVPPQCVHDLIHGCRAITADTALRLARAFSMEPQFWMNLQSRYDLEAATQTLRARIEMEVAPLLA